jgi:hypothetical protein
VSNLFLTLVVTFLLIVIAIACLAAGWLISGRKTRLDRSGKDLTKKSDENFDATPKTDLSNRYITEEEIVDEEMIITEEDSKKESK